MAFCGLDMGTSGCKCAAIDPDGRELASSRREYAFGGDGSGQAIAAEELWAAASGALREVRGLCAEPIEALAVSSFGESFALLDAEGGAMAPVLLYTDPRGAEWTGRIASRLGGGRIHGICGVMPNAMYTLPKLLALAEGGGVDLGKVSLMLPIGPYIAYRLCGEAAVDHSLASRTMMMDRRALRWSDEVTGAMGVPGAMLPAIAPPGTRLGRVSARAADEVGLTVGTVVALGCHDQVAAATGAGTLRPGSAVLGCGSVECLTPAFGPEPKGMAVMRDCGFALVPVRDGLHVTYAFAYAGGAAARWFGDAMAPDLRDGPGGALAALDASVGPEPSGILFTPHLSGAATPHMDPKARGALVGLSMGHGRGDLYRAVLEGVAYEMRLNVEALAKAGIKVGKVRAAGGGARSGVWMQIKADVLGMEIERAANPEVGAYGSALLAGLSVGGYASLGEAMGAAKADGSVVPGGGAVAARYDELYARYRRLYGAARKVMA
ncbi:MAG: FGGY family carbohydrate kinase [Oscillospiraceae bacterium]|nr:FGGY family carbohydrate kinase [Oscillospiraceae bacterium]